MSDYQGSERRAVEEKRLTRKGHAVGSCANEFPLDIAAQQGHHAILVGPDYIGWLGRAPIPQKPSARRDSSADFQADGDPPAASLIILVLANEVSPYCSP